MTERRASDVRLIRRLAYITLALGGAIVLSSPFLERMWLVVPGLSLVTVGVSSMTVARNIERGADVTPEERGS